MKTLYRVFTVLVLLAASAGALFLFQKYRPGANADKTPYKEIEKFAKILQYIEANYVEETKPSRLFEGAINGLLLGLDPHSAYMAPDVYKEMKEETSGKFGGLGIEVTVQDGYITVITPIDDTPAYRAGIKTGDKIIKIDGKSTKDMPLPEAVTLMRGDIGGKVKMTILRQGERKPLEYELARESVKLQSVRSVRLDDKIGYLRISSFMESTADDLGKHLDKLSRPKKIDGLILDLRGNPGGLLDQAVRVVNAFVDEGPVVYTIGRDRANKEVEYAQKGRQRTDVPVVVLVDGSSASASEIVAGALQDYRRAVIAGQKTFGKGSVQTIVPLGDDSGLKLTIARYYTPSGRSIQARGILPDVLIEPVDPKAVEAAYKSARRMREADLEGHFENEALSQDEYDEFGEPILPEPEAPPASKDSTKDSKSSPDAAKALTLEERVKKDYMITQGRRILQTMFVVKGGAVIPQFNLKDEDKDAKAKREKTPESTPSPGTDK